MEQKPLQPPQLSIEFVAAVDGKPAEDEDEPLFANQPEQRGNQPQKEQRNEVSR
jgi:hypothetical protein